MIPDERIDVFEGYGEYDDAQWAEMNLELQRLTEEALDRCAAAGGRFDDLYFLASQLGVGERFRKHHGQDARR